MFVRAPNPIWFMVDLAGLPLNDQYYAFFLTNTLPYLPQNIYRDPQGQTVWTGNVVRFLPNGTLPDNLYFNATLVYRIEIRMGNSQSSPLIYEINNFVPPEGGSVVGGSFLFAENQVSNPNFSQVNFTATPSSTNPMLVLTTAGTYDIAPGWQLVLTGTGTTTLTQLIESGSSTSTSPNAINYALEINNSSWSGAILRQRFNHNGAIFYGGAVNMSLVGRAQSSAEQIAMSYVPSSGDPVPVLPSTTLSTGVFQVQSATVNVLPAAKNTDTSTTAFVDLVITLPTSGIVDITDVQMVGQNTPIATGLLATTLPPYQQQSEERNVDHLFHYYANAVIQQPKTSLLTGWNFSLNPFQFTPTALTNVPTQTAYIADQTIIYQETAGTLQSGKAVDPTLKAGLEVIAIAAATNTRFALIQYITPSTILPYWGDILSSLVKAKYTSITPTPIRVKMRLIYRTTLPPTISSTEPISSWAVNGDPVFAAGWTPIIPLNDPAYILQNGVYSNFSFNQFQMPPNATSNMTLGIVVYTMDRISGATSPPDNITWDKISLVPNKFAVDTQAETFDESLRKCQFYYEKSYDIGVAAGAITTLGQTSDFSVTSSTTLLGFDRPFKVTKRTIPALVFYSPSSGTANNVHNTTTNSDNVVASINGLSTNTTGFPVLTTSLSSGDGLIGQWTADARLGV